MKKSNEKRRVKLFTLWAALILLAASLFTGCPQKPESKPTSESKAIPLAKLKIEGTVLKTYTGEKPSGILHVPESITEIDQYAFFECTGITEVYLPESLTKIGMYAFKNCEGMRKLVLGKNLTHIGYGAFDSCKNLEGKLEFPSDLAEIGASAFSQCSKLSALDFSKCTKPLTIGNNAFEAYGITGTVQFPASLASLGEGAFWNCNKVECFDFYLCSSPPLTAIGSDAFYGTNGRFKVKTGTGIKELLTGSNVPAGKIDATP
ncbi:leucine-rich repeat domain-containing protein [Treponema denticola]|jgi:surface antigen bspA-like|uniref:leucine-rich repeat domain-containing protein n=1 Tax=Treponema denticola TaxID=158 RepID=UPI0020A519FF|nr:leucine-rich repeat domain-containing protein [Treponema denticola]UTC85675.1 leucine-rich repeat domain-containing protein [Treponema denticola]